MIADMGYGRGPGRHIMGVPREHRGRFFQLFGTAILVASISGSPAHAQVAIITVAVGSEPYGIAVNPVTNKIYVANYGSNSVSVIDGATNATSTLPVGNNPN